MLDGKVDPQDMTNMRYSMTVTSSADLSKVMLSTGHLVGQLSRPSTQFSESHLSMTNDVVSIVSALLSSDYYLYYCHKYYYFD